MNAMFVAAKLRSVLVIVNSSAVGPPGLTGSFTNSLVNKRALLVTVTESVAKPLETEGPN